jgi:hypothetical protein
MDQSKKYQVLFSTEVLAAVFYMEGRAEKET